MSHHPSFVLLRRAPLLRILDDGNEELQRVPVRHHWRRCRHSLSGGGRTSGPAPIALDVKLPSCSAREVSFSAMAYCPSDPAPHCGDHSHSVSTVNAESALVVRQIPRAFIGEPEKSSVDYVASASFHAWFWPYALDCLAGAAEITPAALLGMQVAKRGVCRRPGHSASLPFPLSTGSVILRAIAVRSICEPALIPSALVLVTLRIAYRQPFLKVPLSSCG